MTVTRTVAGPLEYWERYYAEQFQFGMGTEDILAVLMQIPPVDNWVDLGSGSESMLWAIGLRARRLVAVDSSAERLVILREFTAAGRPRGIHRTALALCGRTGPDAFTARCRSLQATITTDCLTGQPPLVDRQFDLVSQFGLLGLCTSVDQFIECFGAAHALLAPGGWAAGANWLARSLGPRVSLTGPVYRRAAAHAGVDLLLIRRIASTDPLFPAVFTYVGRKRQP